MKRITLQSRSAIDLSRTNLHHLVIRELATRIIEAEHQRELINFPTEADLCSQLGISRTVLRESMKVLADKGMVEMRPSTGTRSRHREHWNLLDPDILVWKAEQEPDLQFLQELCEVRLAIEPAAAGYAATRATSSDLTEIKERLAGREALPLNADLATIVDSDMRFLEAIIGASHNPLLVNLHSTIRTPFRVTVLHAFHSNSTAVLELKTLRELLLALQRKDPSAASRITERAISIAMLAVKEKLGTAPNL